MSLLGQIAINCILLKSKWTPNPFEVFLFWVLFMFSQTRFSLFKHNTPYSLDSLSMFLSKYIYTHRNQIKVKLFLIIVVVVLTK